MLPSRGLRPAQFASRASHQALHVRANGSRKFSSAPRTSLRAPSRRTSPLQAANWRTGAISPPNGLLTTSSVRYGSWYAPWSWGSSIPPPADAISPTPSSDLVADAPSTQEPVVTSSTPEIAPAGIDSAPVVNSVASPEINSTIEDLLADGVTTPLPTPGPSLTIDHFGQLKELGLDYGWGPSAFFEWLIEHIHLLTGYGWGTSLILSTVAIRTCLFYFQAQGSDNLGKLAAMKPVLDGYNKQMEEAIKNGNQEKEKLYKLKQQQIGQEIGVKLGKGFMGPALIGVFGFGAFRCLRGMSTLPVPGMSEAGFLWFPDLTVSDPYFVLPALTGAVMWVVMKTGGEQGLQNETAQASQQKMLQNIFPIFMACITLFQPATIQLYFCCSTGLGLVTGRLLRMPAVRSLLKISPIPSKKSHEVFSKIIQEKKPIQSIRGKDGKIVYQAPASPSTTRDPNEIRGMKLKPGTKIPTHLAPVLSDKEKERLNLEKEYNRGMPAEGMQDKAKWVTTHYQPQAVWERLAKTAKGKPAADEETQKPTPKPRVERPRVVSKQDSEVERKKRFQNRK